MTDNCHRHTWEIAQAACNNCRLSYCESCLFYLKAKSDQPMCVPCALATAGVRSARQPKVSRKHRRALAHEHQRMQAATALAAADEATVAVPDLMPTTASTPEPSWATLDAANWDIRPA